MRVHLGAFEERDSAEKGTTKQEQEQTGPGLIISRGRGAATWWINM